MAGEKPHDRARHAKAIAEELRRGEVDDSIRTNLRLAVEALGRAAIQMENREGRLMRQAFGPKETS
jgi:hypothetical protein